MSSETSMVAASFRLQEWAAQIKECQSRPAGMSVADWCADNGITKANYYYRLRQVRKACLEHIQEEIPAQQIVPIEPGLLQQEHKDGTRQPGLDTGYGNSPVFKGADSGSRRNPGMGAAGQHQRLQYRG